MKRPLAAVSALVLSACQADRAVSPALSPAGGSARELHASSTVGTTLVNFEGIGLSPGASVEGLGRVHPYLDIHDVSGAGGAARYVVGDVLPEAYVAAGNLRITNGCLGNPGGFMATGSSARGAGFSSHFGLPPVGARGENYDFTFGGLAVTRFSIRMLDFGDFNPNQAASRRVVVTAYDAAGDVVDADVLAFTSGTAESPGTHQVTGDACTAQLGQPGNFIFTVQSVGGARITKVTLRTDEAGADPHVAFDDIELGLALVRIDIKPGGYPNCINNDGRGIIPVAILGSATFDVRTVDVGSVALEGMAVRTAGKASKLLASYEDVNGDGFLDLLVHVQDQDGTLANGTGVATLSGTLSDGTPIVGSDEICIVPPKTGA